MTRANQTKLRLMVVDDETDNLDLLYRTFRREFQVFKADSALRALQILEEEPEEMSIIISDQRMPKMNGTEFLSIAAERFPDTIRILLTGYTDVEDLVGAINAGRVFKYITKPWNPDELTSVVNQAAETYQILKRRTNELHHALRRESLFNAVTTAIRESLDYTSMLQTIVATVGETFAADACQLRPVESRNGTSPKQYFFTPGAFSYGATEVLDLLQTAPVLATADAELLPEADQLKALASRAGDADRYAQIQQQQIQLASENDNAPALAQLVVPLTYQQELLAVMTLSRQMPESAWSPADVQLLEEVAEQAALAISQAKLYQRIQIQTEQMRAELSVARQIQMNLLRQSLPDVESVKIQTRCHAAREVGGDFFEVYQHPQGDIWLAVGDVSGKGVPAALFMASAISVLRRELSQELPPAPNQIMKNLNQSLSDDLVSNNCFITMVLACYTPASKTLAYANAGHIYPMVWSQPQLLDQIKSDSLELTVQPSYLKVRGVPLGILPDWKAATGDMSLNAGDVLLLASDGITEATVSDGSATAMLQQEGLWQLITQLGGPLDLNQILAHIQTQNQIQEDDQTLLSLEVL
jgi:serine phosphatase RsbU (regulator of sigma subunit)/FixJ family two-component response regulator